MVTNEAFDFMEQNLLPFEPLETTPGIGGVRVA